jgi:hypothetical protein
MFGWAEMEETYPIGPSSATPARHAWLPSGWPVFQSPVRTSSAPRFASPHPDCLSELRPPTRSARDHAPSLGNPAGTLTELDGNLPRINIANFLGLSGSMEWISGSIQTDRDRASVTDFSAPSSPFFARSRCIWPGNADLVLPQMSLGQARVLYRSDIPLHEDRVPQNGVIQPPVRLKSKVLPFYSSASLFE